MPKALISLASLVTTLALTTHVPAIAADLRGSSDPSSGVVLIATETLSGQAAGSGMVLTASGEVLTNYHVVEGSTAITVTDPSTGTSYAATVVGHDASTDVALLQLTDATGLATITPDRDRVAPGDEVTAIGNASGGGELVLSPGTVTALEQDVPVGKDGGSTETLMGVIETTAGAVPGDSGGAMVDAEGEVLGMTTAGSQAMMRAPHGRGWNAGSSRSMPVTTVSYAVPIEDALAVVDQIRSGRETDTVEIGPRSYLGVSVVGSRSLVVGSVVTDGPAATAGLSEGSVITSIDGASVRTHAALADALARLDPGQRVELGWTDTSGTPHTASATLGTSPVA